MQHYMPLPDHTQYAYRACCTSTVHIEPRHIHIDVWCNYTHLCPTQTIVNFYHSNSASSHTPSGKSHPSILRKVLYICIGAPCSVSLSCAMSHLPKINSKSKCIFVMLCSHRVYLRPYCATCVIANNIMNYRTCCIV